MSQKPNHDPNVVENHCPECNERESECSCDAASSVTTAYGIKIQPIHGEYVGVVPFPLILDSAEEAGEVGSIIMGQDLTILRMDVYRLTLDGDCVVGDHVVTSIDRDYASVLDYSGPGLLFKAAEAHGDNTGEQGHQVGDLEGTIRELWKILTPVQRTAFMQSEGVRERLEFNIPEAAFDALFPTE